jgi:hypothetical protein
MKIRSSAHSYDLRVTPTVETETGIEMDCIKVFRNVRCPSLEKVQDTPPDIF